MLAGRQLFVRGAMGADDAGNEAVVRLRRAVLRLGRDLRRTSAEQGLSPAQSSALATLVREGPIRAGDLAAAEGLNPTMLSRIVAGMVQDGLLERSSDEGDRRAAWVEVTSAGRKLAQRMRRERTRAVDEALETLSESERRRVEQALPALEALAEELKARRP
jgi:DNA-binding MarR family transcriptional regulator